VEIAVCIYTQRLFVVQLEADVGGLSGIKLLAVAALIGAVIMGVLIFTDTYTNLWSVYPALFQAFWAIPFYLISKFYI